MRRPLDMTCRAAAVALVLLIAAVWTGGFDRIGTLSPEAVQLSGGKAFVVGQVENRLSGPGWAQVFYFGSDSFDSPVVSRLRLFENGQALGPAHYSIPDIAAQGGGRYSHWGDSLFFSVSDYSDPRSNGRQYTLVLPVSPWRVMLVPALVLFGLVCWRQRHGLQLGLPEIRFTASFVVRWRRTMCYAVTIGLAAYILGIYVYGTPPVPLIQGDSFTYWIANEIVPIGYPVFLWTIVGIFGSLRAVVLAQVLIYCASAIAVQAAVERLTGSSVVAGVTAIALLLLGNVLTTAIWMFSESLFTSVLMLHVAASGWTFARRSRPALIAMAVTALAAVTIRPAGYFLFGGILFLLMFWGRERRAVFCWTVCPLVVLAFVYFTASLTLRGEIVGGNSGANLFPHVAHLFKRPPDLSPALVAATSGPVLQAYKEARRRTTSWIEQQNLEVQNFNPVIHEVGQSFRTTSEMEKTFLDLAIYTIETHPFGYLKVVAENFYIWLNMHMVRDYPLLGEPLSRVYQAVWDADWGTLDILRRCHFAAPEVTLAQIKSDYLLTDPSAPLPVFAIPPICQPWVTAAFLLIGGVCATLFVFGYAGPIQGFIGYVAVLAVGGALLVSLSTVFILRYAIPLEPLVLITVTTGVGCALRQGATGMARLARFGHRGAMPSERERSEIRGEQRTARPNAVHFG